MQYYNFLSVEGLMVVLISLHSIFLCMPTFVLDYFFFQQTWKK